MSDATLPPRHYRLTRPDGLGFFRRRSALQFAISCAGGGAVLAAITVTGLGEPGRFGAGIFGVLVVVLGAGRSPTGEDLIDVALPLLRFTARALRGQRRWSAALVPLAGGELPPLFAGIELCELDLGMERHSTERIGVVTDRADGSVSVLFRVHGDGFLLAEPSEQDASVATFGDCLAALAREDGVVSRVSWSQLCAPAPTAEHLAYLASAGRAEPDESMRDAYLALVEETARHAVRTEVLVTLTVGLDRVREHQGSGGDRMLTAAKRALEEATLFRAELSRAGLQTVGPLSPGAIARTLRERLEPTAGSHLDRRSTSLGIALGLVAPENAYPLSIEERSDALVTDGTWHRIFRVAEWPRSPVRADWLASFLCEALATRSFTVVFSPQSRRLARRQALAVATRVGAAVEERERHGRRIGAEERRAQAAAEALDEELEQGAGMELLVGLVDVTAGSADELRSSCDRVVQSAADAGMELRVVGLRQAEALVSSLPLGRVVLGRAR